MSSCEQANSQMASEDEVMGTPALMLLVGVCVCVIEVSQVNKGVDRCSYLIHGGEGGAGWGKGVVNEEEECLLWSQRYTLANQKAQLAHLKKGQRVSKGHVK